MRSPIDSNAGWRATEVSASGGWLRQLTGAEVEAAAWIVEAVRDKPVLQLTRDDVKLGALAPVLDDLTRELEHGIGFKTLRGFPAGRFAPEDNRLLFWAIGTHLGVARPQGKASQLMSDVRAAGGEYRGAGGRGYNTNAELDYHVDGTDVVGLYCLQTARSGGISRVASSVAIHNEILRRDPDLVDRLYEPFPYNRQNEEAADEPPFYMAPIYSLQDGWFAARYIRNHIRSSQLRDDTPRLTERDHRALDIIQELAETDEFRFDMVLEQGDMQFLNNHVMIHSRTAVRGLRRARAQAASAAALAVDPWRPAAVRGAARRVQGGGDQYCPRWLQGPGGDRRVACLPGSRGRSAWHARYALLKGLAR